MKPDTSINNMIKKLANWEIINNKWMENLRLDEFLTLRNKIAHNKDFTEEDINSAQRFRFIIGRLKIEVLENYTYKIANGYFKKFGYRFKKDFENQFDFSAFLSDMEKPKIFFEIKYGSMYQSSANSIIRKLKEFEEKNKFVNDYLVIIYYTKDGKYNNKMMELIDKKIKDTLFKSDKIFIHYTSEYRSDVDKNDLTNFFQDVIERINGKFTYLA